jgi:hypothetical protein
MAATVKETAQSFFETNSQPHSLAGSAMTAKRAGPGVNVTFLEISRKKLACRRHGLLAFVEISKMWQSGLKHLAV